MRAWFAVLGLVAAVMIPTSWVSADHAPACPVGGATLETAVHIDENPLLCTGAQIGPGSSSFYSFAGPGVGVNELGQDAHFNAIMCPTDFWDAMMNLWFRPLGELIGPVLATEQIYHSDEAGAHACEKVAGSITGYGTFGTWIMEIHANDAGGPYHVGVNY